MKHFSIPPTWLIILIVGLPLLSETVYTPSLPDIAQALSVQDAWVEYTLTIYLFGFAIGTLFWGNLSDKKGRKSCLLAGFFIYLLGCLGCFWSHSISLLMVSRFIQAFGGSVGSVLGQAICRDAFHGPALGKIYALVGGALAAFPAIGPLIGGTMDERFGWASIFLFLIVVGILLLILIMLFLPETHKRESRQPISLKEVLLKMVRDKSVIGYGLLVAAANGISFSYYAEGPFFMIELLKLSPSTYGLTFIGLAFATLCGGLIGRKLHDYYSSQTILRYGLWINFFGSCISVVLIFVHLVLIPLPNLTLIGGTLLALMTILAGIALTTSNALSLALVTYKSSIGTASSFFGFFYYTIVSLFTLGMGYVHNNTLYVMPLYFCGITFFMLVVHKLFLPEKI